jgi:cytosine deaminase
VRELVAGGVRVAVGTDNLRDPFDPYLGADPLLNAVLTAIATGMVTIDDFATVVSMQSDIPAAIMRLPARALDEGAAADLVVFEARTVDELLDGRRTATMVIKGGRVIAQASVTRKFSLDSSHFSDFASLG